MKLPVLFLFSVIAWASVPDQPSAPGQLTTVANVNARYTIEAVEVATPLRKRLSRFLREDLERLVGATFDPGIIEAIAQKMRTELKLSAITTRLLRGSDRGHVRVVFDAGALWRRTEPSITKLAYHSRQGWSGGLEGTFDIRDTALTLGVRSDGDELVERFAGIHAAAARTLHERVQARFAFGTFHQQWNSSTLRAVDGRGDIGALYRARTSFAPTMRIVLARPLTLEAGVDITRLEREFPAANPGHSHAWTTTLRYHGQWEGPAASGQELDAGYNLRAATRSLGSGAVYTRHTVDMSYRVRANRSSVLLRAFGGAVNGRAPMFERFAFGNTSTLRGWNKFDIAPSGGDRGAYASAQYRYRSVSVFYDAGSAWDRAHEAETYQSVGASLALGAVKDGPYLTVAFPLGARSLQPLFLVSMNLN